MNKNCALRLRIESQIAEKGFADWEDIINLLGVFPEFKAMYFQYNDGCMENLRSMMLEDGYTISYKSYVEMFSEFVGENLYGYERALYNKIMFE